jgi:hypothetical protein
LNFPTRYRRAQAGIHIAYLTFQALAVLSDDPALQIDMPSSNLETRGAGASVPPRVRKTLSSTKADQLRQNHNYSDVTEGVPVSSRLPVPRWRANITAQIL